MRNTVKILTAMLFITVLLVFGLTGCKKEEKAAAAAPYDEAVKLLEDSYNGDLKALDKLAPADVWSYLQRQGLDAKAHKEKINQKQTDYVKNIQKMYGKDAKVTLHTDSASQCSEETLDKIREGLRKNYGVKKDSVQEAYTMKRSVTVAGTAEAAYEGTEIVAVSIDGKWYILYDHSEEDNPVFYFPYLSKKETRLK